MIQFLFLFFIILNDANGNDVSNCGRKEVTLSYLDVAVDMITKAKSNIPSCSGNAEPVDCYDILLMGHNISGVYTIQPMSRLTEGKGFSVYCDMETNGGGWTVIQRRGEFERLNDYFFKEWKNYKEGFGDIEKDFWLGNDNIFALSNQKQYSVRFDLKDVESNKRYALYDSFWIDDEINKYTLHITEYSGDAGDSMKGHNSMKFTTKDQDNDVHKENNCALIYKGGWWYSGCHHSNLNGLYLKGKHESFADGMNWYSWKGHHESMEWTEIKIRPRNARQTTISTPLR